MEKTDQGWAKPANGYKDPDKNCPNCKGKGFMQATIPVDDIEAVWVGKCPECGSENGTYLQSKGKPAPNAGSGFWRYSCRSKQCSEKDIETVWFKKEDYNPQNN